jgi:TonB family protein
MSFRRVARHLSVRGRLAHHRIRHAVLLPTARRTIGPLTVWSVSLSVVAHVLVTAGAITIGGVQHPHASDDPLVSSRFLYPLMQRPPGPVHEQVRFVGIGHGAAAPAPAPASARQTEPGLPADSLVAVVVEDEAPPAPPPEVFSELEVDEQAERDPESVGPVYPEALLAKQIEGAARVRFVIDSTGHASSATFAVIEANDRAFADAVRAALPHMKFRPASIGMKPVAQKVEQTYVFRITAKPGAVPD